METKSDSNLSYKEILKYVLQKFRNEDLYFYIQ